MTVEERPFTRRAGLRTAVARQAANPLLRSAYSLALNVVLTSVLGVGFWVAAARMFPAGQVGRDSALISAMTVVSTICALNLGSGLLRFLPISKLSPSRVVLGAYGVTTVASVVGAAIFVLGAPIVASSYRFLRDDPILSVLWGLAVVAWGVFALQDAVMTALRRAPWVPLENAAFGVLKFAALPVLLAMGSVHAVFIAWVVPMIAMLVPVNVLIFRRFIPARPARTTEPSPVEALGWRGLATYLANDYLAMIFIQASSTLLPVVVVGILGGRAGAYFYMPFTIINAFGLLFTQIFTSVTVEAAIAPAQLPQLVRESVRRFSGLLAVGVVILAAGATIVLLPFGGDYVHGGAAVLRLMAVAAPLRAAVDLYCAICRVRARAGRVLAVQAAQFVLVTLLAIPLAHSDGLPGVGLAWLIGNVATGAIVLPSLLTLLRAPGPTPATA